MQSYLKQIVDYDKNDIVLAFIGIVVASALILLMLMVPSLYSRISLSFAILITSGGYLLLRNYLAHPDELINPSLNLPHNTGLIITTMISLVIISASVNAFQRPLWVIGVLALLPGFILAQALFVKGHDSLLLQTISWIVTLVLSRITLFPYNGGDTWQYIAMAQRVLQQHTVESVKGGYQNFPLYPTYLAMLSLLTDLTPATLARLNNVLVAIAITILLYIYVRKQFSELQSLVLLLVLLGNTQIIYRLTYVVTMTTVLLFYVLVVIILLHGHNQPLQLAELFVLIFITTIIPFFHPIIAVATVGLLLFFFAIDVFLATKHQKRQAWLGLATYVMVVTLAQWMYYGNYPTLDKAIISLTEAVFSGGEVSLKMTHTYRSALDVLIDEMPFLFLLALAGLEILRQIRLRTITINLYAGVIGLSFVGFGYATTLFGLGNEVAPDRWFQLGAILLVFPASTTLVVLFLRTNWGQIASMGVVVIYVFIGLVGVTYSDQHIFTKEIAFRYDLTSAEFVASLHVQRFFKQNLDVIADGGLSENWDITPAKNRPTSWGQQVKINTDAIYSVRYGYFYIPMYSSNDVMTNFPTEYSREQVNLSQFYDSGDVQWVERTTEETFNKER